MVKRQVVTRQRERNKGRFKDETNYSRKLGKVTFQNYCDSKISKSLWNGSGFNENLSAKFGPNYTGKAGCDTRKYITLDIFMCSSPDETHLALDHISTSLLHSRIMWYL